MMSTGKDRLDKEKELQSKKKELQINERELQSTNKDLQAIEKTMKGTIKDLKGITDKLKQSKDKQSELKTAITKKAGELHEETQLLNNKFKEAKQSLQHQLEINTQLQSQLEAISISTWSFHLHYRANSDIRIVPTIIKVAKFKNYKMSEKCSDPAIQFYTRSTGYKMCLDIYPNGRYEVENFRVEAHLMKGDHDDHLNWPVKGILKVQLLNQLSDSGHTIVKKFDFFGTDNKSARVTKGTISDYYLWHDNFFPLDELYGNASSQCQYLKDDCVFFKVCDFELH